METYHKVTITEYQRLALQFVLKEQLKRQVGERAREELEELLDLLETK